MTQNKVLHFMLLSYPPLLYPLSIYPSITRSIHPSEGSFVFRQNTVHACVDQYLFHYGFHSYLSYDIGTRQRNTFDVSCALFFVRIGIIY